MTEIRMNFQQVPKTPGYLSNYVARPGFKLVQIDLSSVEPRVIAAFSQDETLMKLYGPGAKPNDVYLFNGAYIELFRDEIRKYYDPENPTAESIADAKKNCKKLRSFNKCITLACLAEGTLIRVKGCGFVPIEEIKPGDIVWDGAGWVETEGVVFKGVRSCVNFESTIITPDHLILTTKGWLSVEELRIQKEAIPVRPTRPSADWSDVWKMVCRIINHRFSKWL